MGSARTVLKMVQKRGKCLKLNFTTLTLSWDPDFYRPTHLSVYFHNPSLSVHEFIVFENISVLFRRKVRLLSFSAPLFCNNVRYEASLCNFFSIILYPTYLWTLFMIKVGLHECISNKAGQNMVFSYLISHEVVYFLHYLSRI